MLLTAKAERGLGRAKLILGEFLVFEVKYFNL
jgi:hypothetical protein